MLSSWQIRLGGYISCKTSNRIVRAFLGRIEKGPVVGLEKKVQQALSLIVDDPEDFDAVVQASKALYQALARADSLSYTVGCCGF